MKPPLTRTHHLVNAIKETSAIVSEALPVPPPLPLREEAPEWAEWAAFRTIAFTTVLRELLDHQYDLDS